LREGLEGDANERKEIGDGDGAAFFFGAGALLDKGVDGDDEEAAGYAEEGELNEDGYVADAGIFLPEASPAVKLPMPMPRLRAARR
jgi:hypothetical protein